MATQVKHRRGTNAEILAGTPAIGEIWVNTTDSSIHMGDGITTGGVKHLNTNSLGDQPSEIPTNAIADVLRVKNIDSIADLPTTGTTGQKVSVTGYYAGSTKGGGVLVRATGRHNGGTFFDPARKGEIGTAAYYVDSGVDANCFARTSKAVDVRDYGARESIDSTLAIQATIVNEIVANVPNGTYLFRPLEIPEGKTLSLAKKATLKWVGEPSETPIKLTGDNTKILGGSVIPGASNLRAQRGVIIAEAEFIDDVEMTTSVRGFRNNAEDFEIYSYVVHSKKFTNVHMHDFKHSDMSSYANIDTETNYGFCGFIYFRSWNNGAFDEGCSAIVENFALDHTYTVQQGSIYTSDADGIRVANAPTIGANDEFTDKDQVDNHKIVIRNFSVDNCEKRMIKWGSMGGVTISNMTGENTKTSLFQSGNDLLAAGIEMRGGSHVLKNITMRGVGVYGLLTVDRYEETAGYTSDLNNISVYQYEGASHTGASGIDISHSNTTARGLYSKATGFSEASISCKGNRPYTPNLPQVVDNVDLKGIGVGANCKLFSFRNSSIDVDTYQGKLEMVSVYKSHISGHYRHNNGPFVEPIGSAGSYYSNIFDFTLEYTDIQFANFDSIILNTQYTDISGKIKVIINGDGAGITKEFVAIYDPSITPAIEFVIDGSNFNNPNNATLLYSPVKLALPELSCIWNQNGVDLSTTLLAKLVTGAQGSMIANVYSNVDMPVGIRNQSGGNVSVLNTCGVAVDSTGTGSVHVIGNGLTLSGGLIS